MAKTTDIVRSPTHAELTQAATTAVDRAAAEADALAYLNSIKKMSAASGLCPGDVIAAMQAWETVRSNKILSEKLEDIITAIQQTSTEK